MKRLMRIVALIAPLILSSLKMGWAEGSSELGFQKIVETIQVAKPPKVNSKLLLLVSPKQKPIHPQDLEKRRLEEFYRVDTGPWDFASRVAIETLLSNGQALDQERLDDLDRLRKALLPHPLIPQSLMSLKPIFPKGSKMLDPRIRLKATASIRRFSNLDTLARNQDFGLSQMERPETRETISTVPVPVQLQEIHPIRDLSPLHPGHSEARVTPARFMDLPEEIFQENEAQPSERRKYERVGNRRSRSGRRRNQGVKNDSSLKVLRRKSRAGLAMRRRERRWNP